MINKMIEHTFGKSNGGFFWINRIQYSLITDFRFRNQRYFATEKRRTIVWSGHIVLSTVINIISQKRG